MIRPLTRNYIMFFRNFNGNVKADLHIVFYYNVTTSHFRPLYDALFKKRKLHNLQIETTPDNSKWCLPIFSSFKKYFTYVFDHDIYKQQIISNFDEVN